MDGSDTPDGRARFAEGAILQELRAARKRPGGLSPQAMAQCPVMCDLLGNGDPEVALVELTHKVMELIDSGDDITAVEAASYSLGLCTYADTHLARLEQFGAAHFVDQRQAALQRPRPAPAGQAHLHPLDNPDRPGSHTHPHRSGRKPSRLYRPAALATPHPHAPAEAQSLARRRSAACAFCRDLDGRLRARCAVARARACRADRRRA